MTVYSNDLRQKIVAAYEGNNYSQREVAELFGVCPATVRNLVRRKRETGSTDALPHAGGQSPSLNRKVQSFVQELVKENNDLTLEELCRRVERKYKKKPSRPTICRLLKKLDLPRKKNAARRRARQSKSSESAD